MALISGLPEPSKTSKRSQQISNEGLRARTWQPWTSCLAAQHRIRWFGHVSHLPKAILQFDLATAGWRRPRGKPPHSMGWRRCRGPLTSQSYSERRSTASTRWPAMEKLVHLVSLSPIEVTPCQPQEWWWWLSVLKCSKDVLTHFNATTKSNLYERFRTICTRWQAPEASPGTLMLALIIHITDEQFTMPT